MTFGFRLRINIPNPHTLISADREVFVPGLPFAANLHLSGVGADSLSESERLAFRADGYSTETDARTAAITLREALALSFAALGIGVTFGKDQAGISFSESLRHTLLEAAERHTGEKAQILPDVHGILVFEDSPPPVFLGISGTAVVGSSTSSLLEKLREIAPLPLNLQPKVRLAIELFNAIPFESTSKAQLLSLVTCVEVLAERDARDTESLQVIDRLVALVGASSLDPDKQRALTAGIDGLRRESIGAACAQLVAAHGTNDDRETWRRSHGLRHRLSHAGVASEELQELLPLLTQLVRRILLRIAVAA